MTAATAALPVLDLRPTAFWQNPSETLDPLREAAPVAVTHDGTKCVLRHAEVAQLLADGRFINEGVSLLTRRGFKPGDAMLEYRRKAIGALSGEAHQRVRGLVGRALTLHRIDIVADIVQRRLPAQLEKVYGDEVDALPLLMTLPLQVIGEYLGIDEADRARVDALIHEGQAKAFGREVTPEIVARANAIFAELMQFTTGLIEQRRVAPYNDVLARLLDVEEGRQRLTHDEVIVFFLNLLIGATESTTSAMCSGLAELAREPSLLDALDALDGDTRAVNAFVEEVLRLHPPNTLLANKIAAEPLQFCDLDFAKGETVIIPIPAPNRDPRAYERPSALDLERKPTRHYTFSLGAHFCMGQALARLQLATFFSVFAHSVRSIELCDTPQWQPYAATRTPLSLRLRLLPR